MSSYTQVVRDTQQLRELFKRASGWLEQPISITFKRHKSTRSTEQNDKMWAVLADISRQVTWDGQRFNKEQWKIIISATVERQKAVRAVDGQGLVFFGKETSKMTIPQMMDMIEACYAFGSEQGVEWSE